MHDPEAALEVHVEDSLTGLPFLPDRGHIADLGAGAGLPGLVIAAARPGVEVTLVESVGRKARFIAETAERMGLGNVRVVALRAEEWEGGRGACDAVTARALAALPVLCEYAAPLLQIGGRLVCWKGAVEPGEEADGRFAAAKLGLEVEAVERVAGTERRTLWLLRKVADTPPGYPRRPGMAAKRPIRRSAE